MVDLATTLFFCLGRSWVAFTVFYGLLSICTDKRCHISFAEFDGMGAEIKAL